jgi:hypothetical protein
MDATFYNPLQDSTRITELIWVACLSIGLITVGDFIWRMVYNRYFHPLKRYPGPWLASITRLWLAWHHFWGTELQAQWELIKRHGT